MRAPHPPPLPLLLAALALLPVGPLACSRAPEPRAERVVLVTIDTLRADHVGCYGSPRAHTPSLDAVGAGGVRFRDAISPAPLTLPSHTSILTGLEPPRHGVRNNGAFRLPDDVPTLAESFHDAGFATAAFLGAVVLDRQGGLDRGFDVYDDRMSLHRATRAGGYSERAADAVVDAALAWLPDAGPRFLLWVHLYDPHANYTPPPGFAAAFPKDPYSGEVAFADSQVGRLLDAVDARYPDGRTLVVVTSDHGESLGDHGEPTHSLSLYDATQRVPLLMRGPGVPAGRVVDGLAALIDVAPTVLALTGLPPLPDAQGVDLRELWSGRAPEGDRLVYMETLSTRIDFGWSPLFAVRSGHVKWIRAPRPELYDLGVDPGETDDRAAARPREAAALDAALGEHLRGARLALRADGLDAAERARLEALGYVAAAPDADVEALERVGGVDPKDGLKLLGPLVRAWTLLGAHRFAEAWQLVEPLEGGGAVLETVRARAALGAGHPEEAERLARGAIAEAPRYLEAHLALGDALLAERRLDAAEAAFEETAGLDRADAGAVVGLGRVAEARGDADAAVRRYREAAERRGGSAEATWRLAALLLERGDREAAHALLSALPPDALADPDAAQRLAAARAHAPKPAPATAPRGASAR